MITKDSIETAYCFFHQKFQVYRYSTLDWQKDDIEMAIGAYVDEMNCDLYAALAQGRAHYLKDSATFSADLADAVAHLEHML